MLGFPTLQNFPADQTHLYHLINDERFELVGVWDTDGQKCHLAQEICNHQLNVSDNLEQVKADFFIVATPESTHLGITKKLMNNTEVKLVLFEKPVGASLSEAAAIESSLRSKNISSFVNYPRSIALEGCQLFRQLQADFSTKKRTFVTAWISDASHSALWHLFNLLILISKDARNLSFHRSMPSTLRDVETIVGECDSFTLQLNLFPSGPSSFADMNIYTHDKTYFFCNGFTTLFATSKQEYFGWRSLPDAPESAVDLVANSMSTLYEKVYQFFRTKDLTLNQIETARDTHLVIQRARKIISGD